MYTFQDFEKHTGTEKEKRDFVYSVITAYKGSEMFNTAVTASMYDRHQNKTIMEYQRLLYTLSGEAVADNYSANYKLASNFFNRFIVQEVQFLLGNGVTWTRDDTAKKIGSDFDMRLQMLAKYALIGGVAYGFINYDHLEVFSATEFAPLYDEENGAMMAGVRFWQVADDKPMRATLYEIDGVTDYIWIKGKPETLKEKRPYIGKIRTSVASGTVVYDGENYPTLPIVPLYGNPHKQSELVGLRTEIDAYDLIQSGFANDLDDASQIYWIIENAGGMDDIDLAQFLAHMKRVRAAMMQDDGAKATPHTIEVPYAAREAILTRLEKTMYKDAMALNTETIAGGATTATQIRAAYEPLNNKCDQFEMCICDFIEGIFAIIGIDDKPTFTRSMMVNTSEEIQNVLNASTYLPQEYITEKILTLLGDGDKVEEIQTVMDKDSAEMLKE